MNSPNFSQSEPQMSLTDRLKAHTGASSVPTSPDFARAAGASRPLVFALGVALGVAAITAGAKVAVPIPGTPVPMSLQVPAVLLAGAVLGPVGGFSAAFAYLALGVAGAPVFVAGGGLPYLLGPTGGYLVAFPLAALATGALARPGAGTLRVLGGLVAGILAVHIGGLGWLLAWTGNGFADTLAVSFTPFLVGDLIEIALLYAILRLARPALFARVALD